MKEDLTSMEDTERRNSWVVVPMWTLTFSSYIHVTYMFLLLEVSFLGFIEQREMGVGNCLRSK